VSATRPSAARLDIGGPAAERDAAAHRERLDLGIDQVRGINSRRRTSKANRSANSSRTHGWTSIEPTGRLVRAFVPAFDHGHRHGIIHRDVEVGALSK
jgi:hypothetical protein